LLFGPPAAASLWLLRPERFVRVEPGAERTVDAAPMLPAVGS
jgi:hypothetical protein